MENKGINNILTFTEASQKWNIDSSTLRKLVTTGKLIEDVDYRKSGNVWLITKEAMKKVYGEEAKIRVEEFKEINREQEPTEFRIMKERLEEKGLTLERTENGYKVENEEFTSLEDERWKALHSICKKYLK